VRPGFVPITVKVNVAGGASCIISNDRVSGRCYFYKGQACVIFNKVIVDGMKCAKCLEASN